MRFSGYQKTKCCVGSFGPAVDGVRLKRERTVSGNVPSVRKIRKRWKVRDFGDAEPMGCETRFGYDGLVSDICIRLAQLSDREQLVRLREALWPKPSAEEHARE